MHTKILFLCSGDGGNLRFVYEAIKQEWLPRSIICAVITENICGAKQYAISKGIETHIVDFGLSNQGGLLRALEMLNPTVVVTTINRIISNDIVSSFEGKMINLHYSLLPSFLGVVGTKPVKQAIDYGVKFVGTTVHYVSNDLDKGKPIIQSVTPVSPSEKVDDLMESQFRCGCICLLTAIHHLIRYNGSVSSFDMFRINAKKSYFNPPASIPKEIERNTFWLKMNAST